MEQALEEAQVAYNKDEVPVGAIIIDKHGHTLSRAHNSPLTLNDPTAHSEILALRKAGEVKQNYRFPGCIMITTLEPCIMCMGALVQARIEGLVFGSRDPKSGAAFSRMDFFRDFPWLNHQFWIKSEILDQKSRSLLQNFFSQKRKT